ncbi:MAG: c-type cytochrome biogenesis protein CcsB [Deltaproteobacteria bacterium]|nr:c-type cytochrome biogenesis protein CcsB [Deltaproteobacteria bacterium]
MIKSLMFFDMAFWFYLITAVLYILNWIVKYDWIGKSATVMAFIAIFANTMILVTRTIESGHAPFSNLYESMVLFVWATAIGYLIIEFRYKIKVIGAVVMPLAFIAMFSASQLPYRFQNVEKLNPALQSIWLEIHVFTTFVGYAAFAIAFGLSIMYLIKELMIEKGRRNALIDAFPATTILDELSYKGIMWGFPFLTIGIITGAYWANNAWGTYWSWDPKETWSLITWFIYAAYLHARVTRGWRGKRAAWLSVIGFLAVIFLYWGVSFILPGLHAYA